MRPRSSCAVARQEPTRMSATANTKDVRIMTGFASALDATGLECHRQEGQLPQYTSLYPSAFCFARQNGANVRTDERRTRRNLRIFIQDCPRACGLAN